MLASITLNLWEVKLAEANTATKQVAEGNTANR